MPTATAEKLSPANIDFRLLDFTRPTEEVMRDVFGDAAVTGQPAEAQSLPIETPESQPSSPKAAITLPDSEGVNPNLPTTKVRPERISRIKRVAGAIGRRATKVVVGATAITALLSHNFNQAEPETNSTPLTPLTPVAAAPQIVVAPEMPKPIEVDPLSFTLMDLLPEPVSHVTEDPAVRRAGYSKNKYEVKASRLAQKVRPYVHKEKDGNLIVFDNPEGSIRHASWGSSIFAHALSPHADAFPDDPNAFTPEEIAKMMKVFFDPNPATRGYAASIDNIGQLGDRYIDDGMWNAEMRLVQYAKQLKQGKTPDKTALAEAQTMVELAMENYNPQIGLVRWLKRGSHPSNEHNTISSALSVETTLMLNQFITDPVLRQRNLDFAIQVYNSTRHTMQDPSNHLYYDRVNDGVIDKSQLPYATGVMISAGMWLTQATGDKQYLEQAEQTAQSALTAWDEFGMRWHDPTLTAIFYDRMEKLARVTDNEALRTKIWDNITAYANWYDSLKNMHELNLPNIAWISQYNMNGVFDVTQLNMATLAAIAQDQKAKHNTAPVQQKPDGITVEARAADPAQAYQAKGLA